MEAILGRALPRSARQHRRWWSNTRTHTQAKAWLDAGWRTRGVDTSRETLSFVRSRSDEQVAAFHTDVGGLIHFDGDDAAYMDWLAHNPNGYVVNVRRRLSDDYVVLHRATCPHISSRPQEAGAYTERGYHKLCGHTLADVQQAPVWCGRVSGSFTKRCAHCGP